MFFNCRNIFSEVAVLIKLLKIIGSTVTMTMIVGMVLMRVVSVVTSIQPVQLNSSPVPTLNASRRNTSKNLRWVIKIYFI